MAKVKEKNKNRMLFAFGAMALLMALLIVRVAWIQIVNGEEYTDIAIDQQTSDIPIEAKRGSIFDRNGEELASSATCYTLWVRPAQFTSQYKGGKAAEEAQKLAVILDTDAAELEEKMTDTENVLVRLVDGLEKFVLNNLGEEKGRRFVPLLASIFIYVLTMNLLGLVPGCDAPTANLNTTISIALCVFIYYNYVGIRTWGFGYIHHFTGSSKPLIPLMFPIEIISHLARPLSMSLRLFGNIFAEEMTLIIFFGFGASIYVGVLLGTVPMYFLFLLGKVLQAFILFILSMIYIQGSVEHAH